MDLPPSPPQLSPESADRDTIVRSILPFVNPEVAQVLRSVSQGYGRSVIASSAKLTMKRRVEEILGFEINSPDEYKQDWALTYEILEGNKFWPSLWLTGSEIDRGIAERKGVKKLVPGYKDALGALEGGRMRLFALLLNITWGGMVDTNRCLLVGHAIDVGAIEVLNVSPIIEFIREMNGDDISAVVSFVSQHSDSSPYVFDFFLSNTAITPKDVGLSRQIGECVAGGAVGLVRVFIKYNLVKPFEIIEGASSALNGGNDYTLFWLACQSGCLEMVRLLFALRPVDPNEIQVMDVGSYNLGDLVKYGDLEIVGLLLKSGLVDDVSNYIWDSIQAGRLEMFRLLASFSEAHGNVGAPGSVYHLETAVNNNYVEMAMILLRDQQLRLTPMLKNKLVGIARYNGNNALARALELHD